MKWFDIYMMICVYVWALDVVVTVAVIAIKPLRKWCWKKICQIGREWIEIVSEVFPESEEE